MLEGNASNIGVAAGANNLCQSLWRQQILNIAFTIALERSQRLFLLSALDNVQHDAIYHIMQFALVELFCGKATAAVRQKRFEIRNAHTL